MKNIIVCDIDGCCIESSERLPFFLAGDLDSYHENHALDKPLIQGVEIYRMFLANPLFRVLFVTARCEDARDYTLMQLQDFISPAITNDQLLMRPRGVYRDVLPDHAMKPKLLEEKGYKLDEVFMAFDDMRKTVAEWRSLGIVCYQTAVGEN